MLKFVGANLSRLCLAALLLILLFAFTPVSRQLLRVVNGSFAPAPYSSLALKDPSEVSSGVKVGRSVAVKLANRTGHLETYHWSARQGGALISLGEETVGNGRSVTISVPTRGAVAGSLRIALNGSSVFVTTPLLKP